MTDLLSDEEIERRIVALGADENVEAGENRRLNVECPSTLSVPAVRYVQPLVRVAENLIDSLSHEDGINLGLAEIDILTRGFRPSDLVLVTGFAFSSKTQLVNTLVLSNVDRRILFFSLDDPAEMILAKLVAMHAGVAGHRLETLIRDRDEDICKAVQDRAQNVFKNLLIVDDVIGLENMDVAIQEAADLWGGPPHAVIVDYVEMIPENSGRTDETGRLKALLNALKGKAKEAAYPWIVLHQGTRTNARPGDPISLLSLGFSGEQQATIILGVRRKRDLKDLKALERVAHENTVTVHVVKNKRVGGRCTHYEGVDFFLEPDTGLIRPLSDTERRRLFDPGSSTAAAQRSVQQAWRLGDGDAQRKGEAA